MRKGVVILWLLILFGSMAYLFWSSEITYALPTPVPEKYTPVSIGSHINLNLHLSPGKKPVFLHFFNPECPCSRFNINHFKKLATQYGPNVDFAIIVLSSDKDLTVSQIQKKFNLNIPVLFDSTIAAACGVYSTPQAAILDENKNLFYRGNYNRSRYCTDVKSNYAQMAIESLLQKKNNTVFSNYALKSYGCELPRCTKK